MHFISRISQTKVARITALGLVLAAVVSFIGFTYAADNSYELVIRAYEADPLNNVRVSGASVKITSDTSSYTQSATTDGSGDVSFNAPGDSYTIEISHPDFYTQSYGLLLNDHTQFDASLLRKQAPNPTPTPSPTPNPTPNPTPTPNPGDCSPTPPRGRPMLNIWPISESGANCTDYPLLAAKNLTKGTGYTNSLGNLSAGDVVQVRLYVHNGVLNYDDNIARNVMVKASLPSGSGSISAEAWASNADRISSGQKGGNVSVNLANGQAVEFVSGSVKVYGQNANSLGAGDNSVVSGGMNLGDMRGCFEFLRFVTFEFRVKGAVTPTPTPTPTPNPTPTPTPTPNPTPTPTPTPQPPPPPQPGLINVIKEVRNVTQNQSNFSIQTNANPGDQVEFRIRINTSNTVNNIVANDSLPSKLTYVDNSLRVDGASAGNSITSINIGTKSNAQTQVTFRATVNASSQFTSGTNRLTNTVNITSSVGNDSDTADVIVNITNNPPPPPPPGPTPTLSINKQVRNVTANEAFREITNVRAGERVEFLIEVRNNSNSFANNVRVYDNLPGQLIYVAGSYRVDGNISGEGSFFGNGYSLGGMSTNQTRTIRFEAVAPTSITSNNTVVNTATAMADNTNSVNDTASVIMVPVLGNNIDLRLSKRAHNVTRGVDATTVTALPGDVIQYTLTVENRGTSTSTSYVFEDNINDILQLSELQNFTGSTLNYGNNTLVWPSMDIAAGAKVEKTFTVRVRNSFPAGSDHIMTNVFGNTVNVSVAKPYVAPATGATTTMISALLSILAVAGTVIYRKRELILPLLARLS